MRAYKRFLNYAKIWTSSERTSRTVPTSLRQFDLAHQLAYELKQIGLDEVEVNNYCLVYAKLHVTPGYEEKTKIGFIAHLDTHPDFSGKGVNPQVIANYDGKDVVLGGSGGLIKTEEFPHLKELKGKTLITSDGTTLLGADDKAGIAEIMTALEYILEHQIPHGAISIAFISDQELGSGTGHFETQRFGAQYAYTLDGWEEGEIVYENFNAVKAVFQIRGHSAHTGRAKGVMRNSQLIGIEINGMLPSGEIPAKTEGYEGFYHLLKSAGTVENTQLVYEIRDHSNDLFQKRLDYLVQIKDTINQKYGDGTVSLTIKEEYRNMKEKIEPCFHLIENAITATEKAGVVPKVHASRGGTDGARLSYMGLPCPNLGIGGYAYHGLEEHITAEAMDAVAMIVVQLIKKYAE